MTNQDDDANGIVIKIPASFLPQQDKPSDKVSKATNEYQFFTRTGIVKIQGFRYTEHGKTEVHSLGFSDYEQRLKILELLDIPVLYNKLSRLINYIYQLGCELEGEKRYYAAVAASELSTNQPFLDIKEGLILPWAKTGNPWIQNSAAVALSHMMEHKRYESDVLMLLKHWISSQNPMLVEAALSTYFRIAHTNVNATLEAIGTILKNGGILECLTAIDLFGMVYDSSPTISIEKLYNWLNPITNTNLCNMACLLFLINIRLDDATESDDISKKIVDTIYNLWEMPTIPTQQETQEQTTIKIEKWASEILTVWDKESSQVIQRYLALFHGLYKKYEDSKRRNRLEYHLQRWEKNRLWKQDRELAQSRKGKNVDGVLNSNIKVSYDNLRPSA